MKARVKATGEIVNVKVFDKYFDCNGRQWVIYEDEKGRSFNEKHLEFNLDNSPLDYWEKLKHQYAGMAMQGLMSYVEQITPKKGRSFCDEIVDISFKVATALVEKLKGE